MAAKGRRISRIEPELLAILNEINDKRNIENLQNATVTIEDDPEDDPVDFAPDAEPDE